MKMSVTSNSSMEDLDEAELKLCDIVKRGPLHIKRPPTPRSVKIRLKTWQKRFFVLRDTSYNNGTTMLEIYNSEHAWVERNAEHYLVDLAKVSHVEEYNESKNFPNAFTVTRTGQSPLVMGAETVTEMTEWILALKCLSGKLREIREGQDVAMETVSRTPPVPAPRRPSCPSRINMEVHHVRNSPSQSPNMRMLRLPKPKTHSEESVAEDAVQCCGHVVTVVLTEASQRNDLSGDFLMVVRERQVALRRLDTEMDCISWPFGHIRKFKCDEYQNESDLITLEANIKCGHREGQYQFRTHHGKALATLVRDNFRRNSQQHLVGKKQEADMDRLKVTAKLVKGCSTPDLTERSSTPKPPLPPRKVSNASLDGTLSSSTRGVTLPRGRKCDLPPNATAPRQRSSSFGVAPQRRPSPARPPAYTEEDGLDGYLVELPNQAVPPAPRLTPSPSPSRGPTPPRAYSSSPPGGSSPPRAGSSPTANLSPTEDPSYLVLCEAPDDGPQTSVSSVESPSSGTMEDSFDLSYGSDPFEACRVPSEPPSHPPPRPPRPPTTPHPPSARRAHTPPAEPRLQD